MTEKKRPQSSQWERQQKAREEKLKAVDDAIESGSMVVRQMTPAERKANPPKPRPERGERKKR